ncbi:hypothetical protein [Nitrosopumilus sp. b1]|uniref:hypothetical protein n=1 Tax=Nitrosopumilus sp. b1 TaxID=2109907 RepID=UPI002107D7EB|nr:hypothetical protein [Nitrosopumilus sp. b1]
MSDNSNIDDIDEEFRLLAEKRKKLAELTRGLSNSIPQHESDTPSDSLNEILSEPEPKEEPIEDISSRVEQETFENEEIPNESTNDVSSEKENSTKYDDGKLALSKDEILEFCDRIITKWQNDPTKDARHIFAMNAVKTSVIWTEEETLKEIWKEIFTWAFDILYKNAIAQAKGENMKWSQILDQIGKS